MQKIQNALANNDLEEAKSIMESVNTQLIPTDALLANLKELTKLKFGPHYDDAYRNVNWFLTKKLEPLNWESPFSPFCWLVREHEGLMGEDDFSDYSDLDEDVDFFLPYDGELHYVTWKNIKTWFNTTLDNIEQFPNSNFNFTVSELEELKTIIKNIEQETKQENKKQTL